MSMSGKHSYIISMSDVVTHPLYEKYKDNKEDCLNMMLTLMGMDINKHIEESHCMHRSEMTGVVAECPRFVGSERQDKAWKLLKIKASGALV